MIAVGIDPGLTGGIAILGGEPEVYDMPVMAYSPKGFVKRAVDCDALAGILRPYAALGARLFMERVNAFPGQGVGSMFSLGMSYWGAYGVAAALGMSIHLVEAKAWKTHFGLSKDKSASLDLARRLFPTASLVRAKDHGRAEALLIARYGQETNLTPR
jgi:crossover junction endodeoxyribonuclease RuvC